MCIFIFDVEHVLLAVCLLSNSNNEEISLVTIIRFEAATGDVLSNSVLTNFAKFTGKHLCQSLFLIKSQA